MQDLWRRHFYDSAQLAALVPPGARSLVDLGSGAGFPGLVLAELLRDRPHLGIVLIEATRKKANFLSHVAERLGLRTEIRNARVEDCEPEPSDVVTARACAPLPKLLAYAERFWGQKTVGLFPKGQNVAAELTEAHKYWSMTVERHASLSDPSGIVLELRELHGVRSSRPNRRG